MSEADGENLTYKKVEISVENFNSIAIPHHVSLLTKYRDAITELRTKGDEDKVKNVHVNATRVIAQLRQLLQEMDRLRRRLAKNDIPKFDRMTKTSTKRALDEIKDYIETFYRLDSSGKPCVDNSPPERKRPRLSIGEVTANDSDLIQIQMLEENVTESESLLDVWEKLNEDIRDIHEIFAAFDSAVRDQAQQVNVVEENCEAAAVNVDMGRRSLLKAELLSTQWYPLAGALAGGLIAGPFGLIAGIKLGGFAALSGSALGFTGGKILKKKKELPLP